MTLEVFDQGRFERIALRGVPSREIDGREYIGGYHLDGRFDEVWFDKEYSYGTLVSSVNGTDTYRLIRKAL